MKKLQCVLAMLLIAAMVKTASGQTVTSFTLVNPFTDQDIRPMVDFDEFPAKGKYTIRANADAQTESVVFYLNGIFHHIENDEPYSLFWDHKANYNQGNLIPGSYTLTAIPYTKNNAKGTQGTSLTINFTVYGDTKPPVEDEILTKEPAPEIEVSVYPNPVLVTAFIEVSGTPESSVSIDLFDKHGNAQMKYQSKLSEEGTLQTELDATKLKKGTYLLSVRLAGKTLTKRLQVD